MKDLVKIAFGPLSAPKGGALVVFVDGELKLGVATAEALGGAGALIGAAAETLEFKGKAIERARHRAPRRSGGPPGWLLVVGTAPEEERQAARFRDRSAASSPASSARPKRPYRCCSNRPARPWEASAAAEFALGFRLRSYKFDKYKTKKPDSDEPEPEPIALNRSRRRTAKPRRRPIRAKRSPRGSNSPAIWSTNRPTCCFPKASPNRRRLLSKLGVDVEILDEKAMTKLGMGSLLAVGQGSHRESRLVVMRWRGVKSKKAAPVAFVGKGVCFDTGGISIKPAAGMEDMKGDMGGAACVVGLMHALAKRKAKVHAVGVIGLVENMPDGKAYRPGDILTSMSGQTIEVINTDAKGASCSPTRCGT